MNSLTIPINDIIGISLGVMLLWIGGKEVIIYKNLDPDGFIKYIIFLFAMLQPAKKIGAIFTEIQSGLASAERVFDLINIESNIKESKNPKKITRNIRRYVPIMFPNLFISLNVINNCSILISLFLERFK